MYVQLYIDRYACIIQFCHDKSDVTVRRQTLNVKWVLCIFFVIIYCTSSCHRRSNRIVDNKQTNESCRFLSFCSLCLVNLCVLQRRRLRVRSIGRWCLDMWAEERDAILSRDITWKELWFNLIFRKRSETSELVYLLSLFFSFICWLGWRGKTHVYRKFPNIKI